eukprot:Stramenopile-MAST_4_protein_1011
MGIGGRSYSRAGGALRCGALRSFSVRRVVVFFELVKKVRFERMGRFRALRTKMPVCEAVVFVLFLLCPATIFATCPSYPAVGNPKFTGTGTKSDPFVIAPFVDAGPKSDTMGIRLPYNFGTFVGQTDDNKCDTKEESVEEPDCMCYASSENVPLVWLENTVIWIPGCASANPPVSGVKPSWIDAYYAVTPNCNANDDDSDASWYCQSTPKLKTFQSNSPPAVSSTIPTLNDGGPRPCIQCQQGTRLKALYNYLPSPELLDSDNVYGYGLTACLACGKGQFQDQTRHIQQSCKNCALGKHAPRVLMDACFDCPPGTSQPALGQAACVPCVAGFYFCLSIAEVFGDFSTSIFTP